MSRMLLCLILACGGASVSPDWDRARLVTIQTRALPRYQRPVCGGVAVSQHVFVTAHHCHHSLELKFVTRRTHAMDGPVLDAQLVKCETRPIEATGVNEDGWCAYRTNHKLAHYAPPVERCPQPIVTMVGHGDYQSWRARGPYWAEYRTDGLWHVFAYGDFAGGDSGGPALCADGESALGVFSTAHKATGTAQFISLRGVVTLLENQR